jgi:hypothetical protein
LAAQDRFNRTVDGNYLVVARDFPADFFKIGSESISSIFFFLQPQFEAQALPEFIGRWELSQRSFLACKVIVLDNAMTIAGVGELDPQ